MNIATKKIALTALMTALTTVLTLVSIPLPGGGYYNFGDVAVFVAAATLGPFFGAFVGGAGGALGDLCLGYAAYAPFTLVIKASEALIAGALFRAASRTGTKEFGKMKKTVVASFCNVAGGLVMAAGYFLAEGLILSDGRWQGGIVNLPWNVLQGSVSAVVAAATAFVCGIDRLTAKVLGSDVRDGFDGNSGKRENSSDARQAKKEKTNTGGKRTDDGK